MKRLIAFVDQYFFHRALPHGIVSWRYLLPNTPPQVRIHRRVWLMGRPPSVPLALFLVIEFILWLKWVVFAGWRYSWRIVQRWGNAISEQEGISKAVLLKRVVSMSLGHCMPPAEIYAFGLYRSEPKQKWWNYVYTHELPAFHRWRSLRLGETPESLALLQDKRRLTQALSAHGVPMAPVLGLVTRGAVFDPAVYLQPSPRLFCKPRHGSSSRDAFIIEEMGDGKGAAIFAVKSGMKAQPLPHAHLQAAMAKDDFLVQPFMENHPKLAALCPTKDAATLRLITEIHPVGGIKCWCAALEIPNDPEVGFFHIILPLEPSSGHVMRFPGRQRLSALVQSRYDAARACLERSAVPFWEEMKKNAIIAHQLFPDVYAIAWDFVITADGPYMLEGNTGWATKIPQMLYGGLLKNERED